MQPNPRSPDLVWPGQLHGMGCLSAQALDTGFPTVVWCLCLGPGCGWVWASVTPAVLAGVFGGCVLVRFVVSSLFSRPGFCGVCGWAWVLSCTPPFVVGDMGRVWLRARSACTPPAERSSAPRAPHHTRSCSWVQHPHSRSIGNGAGVGCRELQPKCSSTKMPTAAAATVARVTRLRCCSSALEAAAVAPGHSTRGWPVQIPAPPPSPRAPKVFNAVFLKIETLGESVGAEGAAIKFFAS